MTIRNMYHIPKVCGKKINLKRENATDSDQTGISTTGAEHVRSFS